MTYERRPTHGRPLRCSTPSCRVSFCSIFSCLTWTDVRTRNVGLIAVTAFAMKGDEEKAFEAGFDAYLTKPIDKSALREVVRRYMDDGASGVPSNAT